MSGRCTCEDTYSETYSCPVHFRVGLEPQRFEDDPDIEILADVDLVDRLTEDC